MRTIICGGRDRHLNVCDGLWLDQMMTEMPITRLICGMAKGIDTDALLWARSRGLPVDEFPADELRRRFGGHGPKMRNGQMAMAADACIAFPGGSGTQDMVDKAIQHGLRVLDCREGGKVTLHWERKSDT